MTEKSHWTITLFKRLEAFMVAIAPYVERVLSLPYLVLLGSGFVIGGLCLAKDYSSALGVFVFALSTVKLWEFMINLVNKFTSRNRS